MCYIVFPEAAVRYFLSREPGTSPELCGRWRFRPLELSILARDDKWQPLGFATKSLTPAQQKYSAYDRELLAIYTAIKRFRHAVEGRKFIIYSDHIPLVYAFRQKLEKFSPRQFRYLDYIAQFTTDIRYVKGVENDVGVENVKTR